MDFKSFLRKRGFRLYAIKKSKKDNNFSKLIVYSIGYKKNFFNFDFF